VVQYEVLPLHLTVRIAKIWRRKWVRVLAIALAVPTLVAAVAGVYYYVSFSRLIDARLHGERDRVLPRVFARPVELRRGQTMTERQLIDRLNDLGYTQRARADNPGEFAMATSLISIMPRAPELKGKLVRVVFPKPPPPAKTAAARAKPPRVPDRVERLEVGSQTSERVTLERPVLTALITGEREKRRDVALSVIPPRVLQAVLAIEDRRFYAHPGVDPIGVVGALFSYLSGRRGYLAGGSTITQQLVRNVFLPKFEGMTLRSARARSLRRKVLEIFVSVVLTSRASKDEILELYLNNIPLGQRGSFAISGVPASSSRRRRSRRSTTRHAARSAATSSCRRWPTRAISPATTRRMRHASRWRWSSVRSKPRRRTSSTSSGRRWRRAIPDSPPPRTRRSMWTPHSTSTCSAWRRMPCAMAC
jgi:hypothetical protein